MGKLLKLLLDGFASSFLKRLLAGAGISLISGTVILGVISYLVNRFMTDFMIVGNISGLVGISGLDQCISIVISAFIARAMITSTSLSLSKV